jgi:hypothetical protein
MPYKEANQSEPASKTETHDELPDGEDELIDPPASRGADLLLSLTKDRNPVVTPMDSIHSCFTGSMTSACSTGSSSPNARMGPPVGESRHRLLYHSPIKIASLARSPQQPPQKQTSQGSSGSSSESSSLELAPYPMGHAPAWSPSSFNGMDPVFHASFGRSPHLPKRQMNFEDDHEHGNNASMKRLRNRAEEKKEDAQDEPCDKSGKRLISPSSSNEKPEDESESSLHSSSSFAANAPMKGHYPFPWGVPHPHHHHPMYLQHHWPPPPPHGYPMPYPPPPYGSYPHFPHPPWGMHGHPLPPPPPPPGSMPMHPPGPIRNAAAGTKNALDALSKRSPESGMDRCVVVANPIPNKYWS